MGAVCCGCGGNFRLRTIAVRPVDVFGLMRSRERVRRWCENLAWVIAAINLVMMWVILFALLLLLSEP